MILRSTNVSSVRLFATNTIRAGSGCRCGLRTRVLSALEKRGLRGRVPEQGRRGRVHSGRVAICAGCVQRLILKRPSHSHLIYRCSAWRRHVLEVRIGTLVLQKRGLLFRIDRLHEAHSRLVVRKHQRPDRLALHVKGARDKNGLRRVVRTTADAEEIQPLLRITEMGDALTCDALSISFRFSEIPFTLRLMELTMSMAFTKLASISSRQRVMFSSTEFMQGTAG